MPHWSLAKHLGESGALVRGQWPELTPADLEEAAGERGAFARIIARRYCIPVGAAKQQVRDFLRTVGTGGAGRAPGGKKARRAGERIRSLGGEGETAAPTEEQGAGGADVESTSGSVVVNISGSVVGSTVDVIGVADTETGGVDGWSGGWREAESPGGLGGHSGTKDD